jgi:phage-related protein (TIGR01555 family)
MGKANLKAVEASKKAVNSDAWRNIITGLGTGKDKTTYSVNEWVKTPKEVAESLFSSDEIGAKAAKIIPYDGTREGITWDMDSDADHETIVKFIESEMKRLKAWEAFAWAWTLARVYGGSGVFMSVDDGRKLDRPLKPEKVKRINTLTVFDRFELESMSSDIITDISDPNYGKPEFYRFQSSGIDAGNTVMIHHSRILRFDGIFLPMRLYIRNNYWHDSIYGSLYQAIRNYASVHDSIAVILQEFNQPVFHIEGMSEALAQDEDELVMKKLEMVNLMRSVARAVVLDKEDLFTNVSTNVAGGKELVDLTVQRLVAGIDVPHTRLLGNSPTGLGGTGQSELINYYDNVKAQQKVHLRDPIEKLTDLLFFQTGAPSRPEDLNFEFNPLFQLDKEKELRTKQMQADIDETYIKLGVYDTYEAANSRFGTGRYRFETVLSPGEGQEGTRRIPPQNLASTATSGLGALDDIDPDKEKEGAGSEGPTDSDGDNDTP